jgi:hypothetical protein
VDDVQNIGTNRLAHHHLHPFFAPIFILKWIQIWCYRNNPKKCSNANQPTIVLIVVPWVYIACSQLIFLNTCLVLLWMIFHFPSNDLTIMLIALGIMDMR